MKFSKTLMAFLASILLCNLSTSYAGYELPTPQMQKKILLKLRNEMIRLDGEGLLARKDRPQSFKKTTGQLSKKVKLNKTTFDFFNSFQQLNATYTNLHSRAIFTDEVNLAIDLPWYKNQSVGIFSEVIGREVKLKVKYIDDPEIQEIISEGDEVVAINGIKVKKWLKENFLFCKYSLRVQCDRVFEINLLSLMLSWKGDTDLTYTANHDGVLVDVKVKFSKLSSVKNYLKKRCDWKADERYSGFKLIYLGFFTCLYEKIDDPKVALLRISSFQYNRNQIPENPYKNIREEVSAFEKVWIPNSDNYKDLIIDVLDNRGGNLPIAYYQVLLKGEFQEQYVQFKKTSEMENEKIRSSVFWNDKSHELQYQQYLKNGLWEKLKYGEFTPPEPMFCADENKPCSETTFQAKPHNFNGKVHIMVNESCVSSCDGFVWAMKTKLNAELYGFYQAADAAYSRLRLDAIKDESHKDGFRIEINSERSNLPEGFIVGQVIAVSRSVDENGSIINGSPLPLKKIVDYRFGEFYPSKVLSSILHSLD